jgi:hypothetical protein
MKTGLKYGVRVWTGFKRLRTEQMVRDWEHFNRNSDFIKGE